MAYIEEFVRRYVGKAINNFNMIAPNEEILVGISGKDSIVMYFALKERLSHIPISYKLHPVHVDLGFDQAYTHKFLNLTEQYGIHCDVIKTQIGVIAHSNTNRENPCFLCAWNRRKVLFEEAEKRGIKKIALGHNRDDAISTFLINLFYSGSPSPLYPKQEFFGGKITIIRPVYMIPEDHIIRFIKARGLIVPESPCPTSHRSKRKYIKELLKILAISNKKLNGNIFAAILKLLGPNSF